MIRLAVQDDAPMLARLAERTFREAFAADNSAAQRDLIMVSSLGG
jgi:hypothetical protein